MIDKLQIHLGTWWATLNGEEQSFVILAMFFVLTLLIHRVIVIYNSNETARFRTRSSRETLNDIITPIVEKHVSWHDLEREDADRFYRTLRTNGYPEFKLPPKTPNPIVKNVKAWWTFHMSGVPALLRRKEKKLNKKTKINLSKAIIRK